MWCGCVAEIGKEDLCHHHFEDITDTCMLEESVGSGGLAYFNFSFLMIDYGLWEVWKIVCILHFVGPFEMKFRATKLAKGKILKINWEAFCRIFTRPSIVQNAWTWENYFRFSNVVLAYTCHIYTSFSKKFNLHIWKLREIQQIVRAKHLSFLLSLIMAKSLRGDYFHHIHHYF